MTAPNDRAYFLRRAREERELASSSEDTAVALTHFRFADEYQRRADALPEAPARTETPMHAEPQAQS